MKTLSIDIETYSDVPLPKTGVYRYCESPNFEILLFAYSIDSAPVQVIDLARGERIPDEIISALEDESVIKWAFNAAFERICLSRFLGHPTGEYLSPESWRCSMIWSATMGLPLSLEGVGAVLGLEKQKLTEGKDLIKYFCQPCAPTKSNGQRTRNYPYHAPDKWSAFKKYNIRDVETEMGIQHKLRKFPVNEEVLQQVFVKALNELLPHKESYQQQLQANIAYVIRLCARGEVQAINEQLIKLQQELLDKVSKRQNYDDIADEIFQLREKKAKTNIDTSARDEQIERITDLQDFIKKQSTELTEFDENLVRRWLKKITIYEDKYTVEFKSGVSVDIEG